MFLNSVIEDFFNQSEVKTILDDIDSKINYSETVYPPVDMRFRALQLCPYPKVVILGQDPYHNGSADGLAFSSQESKVPKSLINIFETLKEQGFECKSPNLESWAKQGVLLLNTSFSVIKGRANSHASLWSSFTEKLILYISDKFNPIWLLWGNNAKSYKKYISGNDKVYEFIHPSPLNGKKFVLENREIPQFLRVNKRLKKKGLDPIDWST